jgi:hypothetical protein
MTAEYVARGEEDGLAPTTPSARPSPTKSDFIMYGNDWESEVRFSVPNFLLGVPFVFSKLRKEESDVVRWAVTVLMSGTDGISGRGWWYFRVTMNA